MIKRYMTTASMVCTMALGMSGSAFAADAVTISGTGADSKQIVEIDNSSEVNTTNTTKVEITNANFQQASTGDVKANENTSLGGNVSSGNASNANTTDTSVKVSNGNGCDCVAATGNGGGTVTPGSGNGGGVSVGSGSGKVLGASKTGFGMGAGASVLPEVGAKFPVDVSAMRAAWNSTSAAPINLAKHSTLFTNAMLLTAALLSLIGAAGSVWYAKRREERI